MSTPQISSYYIHWLYDYVREKGAAPEPALGELASKTEQPFYSMQEWGSKLTAAAQLLDDSDLGLHFGCTITPHRFGVLGYLLHHCDTLLHAFLRMQQYQRLLFHLQNSRISKNGNRYTLGWQLSATCPIYHEETFTLASVLQFSRTLTGQAITPEEVGLMSSAPANADELERFLGCKINFNQSMTSITDNRSLLSLKNAQPDAALRTVLEEQANALLAALPEQDKLLQIIRRSIVALLQSGEPTVNCVAAKLNLSSRTLQRRLAERDYRFKDLLEKTRRELAESYLKDSHISLAEVALLLGYSEQSPFTHAFKRWTGLTPFEWRKQLK